VLFIDARTIGTLVDRTHRGLSDDEMGTITDAYHSWRGENNLPSYEDIAGFCASATTEQIAEHRYVLTPGRYVGTEEPDDDGEPIQEKIQRLKAELFAEFADSDRLQAEVRSALETLDA
jgi:type I restriction enzyme M protein